MAARLSPELKDFDRTGSAKVSVGSCLGVRDFEGSVGHVSLDMLKLGHVRHGTTSAGGVGLP